MLATQEARHIDNQRLKEKGYNRIAEQENPYYVRQNH